MMSEAPKAVPMRTVTREEYLAFIRQFHSPYSYRTGICEPPQEHCVDAHTNTLIGRIVLEADMGSPDVPNRYEIADGILTDRG